MTYPHYRYYQPYRYCEPTVWRFVGDRFSPMEREMRDWKRQFDRIPSDVVDRVPSIGGSGKLADWLREDRSYRYYEHYRFYDPSVVRDLGDLGESFSRMESEMRDWERQSDRIPYDVVDLVPSIGGSGKLADGLWEDRPYRYYDPYMGRGFGGDSFWRMERERRDWERQFDRIPADVVDLVPSIGGSGKLADWTTMHAIEFTDLPQCIIRDPQGKPMFQAQLNVKYFKPEEIAVSTKGNQVLVTAKHEEVEGQTREYREYNRRLDLPPEVEVGGVSTTLCGDGLLAITAPLMSQAAVIESSAAGSEAREAKGKSKEGETMEAEPAENTPVTPLPAPTAVVAKEVGVPVAQLGTVNRFAFQLPVPVCFKPDEISVNTEGRKLVIRGRHEETKGKSESMHAFEKYYLLAPNVDKEKMNVYLKNGRSIIVEAPLKDSGEPLPNVHVLPIDHKSGS